MTGIEADRYVRVRDSGFINIVKLLGDISYINSSATSYTSDDIVIELSAGEQLLNPVNALKLVKYNNTVLSTADAAYQNAYLLGAAICSYYTEENALKGESLFTSVVNFTETDISFIDYTNAKAAVCGFAVSETRQSPVIVSQGNVSSPFTTVLYSEVETNG